MNTRNKSLIIRIPQYIYNDSELKTFNHKLILAQIDFLHNSKGCSAKNSYFEELFMLKKTYLKTIISDLVRLKKITIEGSTTKRVLKIVTRSGDGLTRSGDGLTRSGDGLTRSGDGLVNIKQSKAIKSNKREFFGDFFINDEGKKVKTAESLLLSIGVTPSGIESLYKAGISHSLIAREIFRIKNDSKIDNKAGAIISAFITKD